MKKHWPKNPRNYLRISKSVCWQPTGRSVTMPATAWQSSPSTGMLVEVVSIKFRHSGNWISAPGKKSSCVSIADESWSTNISVTMTAACKKQISNQRWKLKRKKEDESKNQKNGKCSLFIIILNLKFQAWLLQITIRKQAKRNGTSTGWIINYSIRK